MTKTRQILELFDNLDRYHQLWVIELLVDKLRQQEWQAQHVPEPGEEPGYNAPYHIPEGMCTPDQLDARGEQ